MSRVFLYVNKVDSHNKSKHSDLVLEKYWVTLCVWIRLCTAVDIVITVANLWKFLWG